jgi:hypothetical protein
VMDPDLFKFPFVYGVEVGGMYFSDQDAVRMREEGFSGSPDGTIAADS